MTTLLAQFAIADCLCRCGTLVQVLATQGSDRNSKTEQTQKLSRVCSDGESPTEFTVRNETYETDLKVNCPKWSELRETHLLDLVPKFGN